MQARNAVKISEKKERERKKGRKRKKEKLREKVKKEGSRGKLLLKFHLVHFLYIFSSLSMIFSPFSLLKTSKSGNAIMHHLRENSP